MWCWSGMADLIKGLRAWGDVLLERFDFERLRIGFQAFKYFWRRIAVTYPTTCTKFSTLKCWCKVCLQREWIVKPYTHEQVFHSKFSLTSLICSCVRQKLPRFPGKSPFTKAGMTSFWVCSVWKKNYRRKFGRLRGLKNWAFVDLLNTHGFKPGVGLCIL